MTFAVVFPPGPHQPLDSDGAEVWAAFVAAQLQRRQVQREDEYDAREVVEAAAKATYRAAHIAALQRRAVAAEKVAATNQKALYAELVTTAAAQLMVDRTASTSTPETRAKHLVTCLADAKTIADEAMRLADERYAPAPDPTPAPEPAPTPAPTPPAIPPELITNPGLIG